MRESGIPHISLYELEFVGIEMVLILIGEKRENFLKTRQLNKNQKYFVKGSHYYILEIVSSSCFL